MRARLLDWRHAPDALADWDRRGAAGPVPRPRLVAVHGAAADEIAAAAGAAGARCAAGVGVCYLAGTEPALRDCAARLAREAETAEVGAALASALDAADAPPREWRLGRFHLDLSQPRLMAIVNASPESEATGGRYAGLDGAVRHAAALVTAGAAVLDVGGQSAAWGTPRLSAAEERERVVPLIARLAGEFDLPITVDTWSYEVAAAALDAGAAGLNDISGLQDERLAALAAERGAGLALMHLRGAPKADAYDPVSRDIAAEVAVRLHARMQRALALGVARDQLAVDPGYEFGQTLDETLALLRRQRELRSLGVPILVGLSQKQFQSEATGLPADERLETTAACVALAVANGADVVRVHDVAAMRRVALVAAAIAGRAASRDPAPV